MDAEAAGGPLSPADPVKPFWFWVLSDGFFCSCWDQSLNDFEA